MHLICEIYPKVILSGFFLFFEEKLSPNPKMDRAPLQWVASFAAPQSDVNEFALSDQTIRAIVHLSLGGNELIIKLTNDLGTDDVFLDKVTVGIQQAGASILPGSLRLVTFGDSQDVRIVKGSAVSSDPIVLKVDAESNIVISIHTAAGNTSPPSRQIESLQEFFIATSNGDLTEVLNAASFEPFLSFIGSYPLFYVSGVDVKRPATDAIVAIGDSITNGAKSTVSANRRWTNFLSRRLILNGMADGVANSGLIGNQVSDFFAGVTFLGPSALDRLNDQVFSVTGVRYIIIYEGINDLSFGHSTDQIIAAYKQIYARSKARGLLVYIATLTPTELPDTYATSAIVNPLRQIVNAWIRENKHNFDGVIDFDKAVRMPSDKNRTRVEYASGDGIHFNDYGYQALANAIDLRLFKTIGQRPSTTYKLLTEISPPVATGRQLVRSATNGARTCVCTNKREVESNLESGVAIPYTDFIAFE